MNISKIKQKYKQILQQNQQEKSESDSEWELTCTEMKKRHRKTILGETNTNIVNRGSLTSKSTSKAKDDDSYLRVKEKLAQSLLNLQKKDKEIYDVKNENVKLKEQIKILQDTINKLKQSVSSSQNKLMEQKVAYSCIQKSIQALEKNVEEEKIDKQLLNRQISFYQNQINESKKQIIGRDSKIQELLKMLGQGQKYIQINNRLRDDVSRLKELLSETEKYKIFSTKIDYKNYIGRQTKQQQNWINQSLVSDVDNFIKRQIQQQILNSNISKQFVNNLIKFIAKNIQSTKVYVERKLKKSFNSKLKDHKRRQNHSMNLMEIREQELRKSRLGNSLLKSRRNTLNDSKLATESFIYSGALDKSFVSHSNIPNSKCKDVCIEILSSFRKSICQLLDQKQIKKKKMLKLVDWLVDAITVIFPKQRLNTTNLHGDFRLQTEEIKITL